MKKQMQKGLAVLLCAVLLFTLAACGGKGGADTDAAEIILSLDWTPNTNHTGIYVALEKGYFADAGLKVTVVQPAENGAASMCAAGQAQFAIEAQDTLAAAFIGDAPLEVTAVAALLQHNTSGIISRKGEGMHTPKGLEGKTYSTWDSPIEQAMLKYVMEKDGGDYAKVNLIPNNVTDEAGALKEHLTDAIWIFYGWGGISAQLSGLDFDYFNFTDIDKVFDYYTPVLIGNNAYMQSHEKETRALLAALEKGYTYAVEHPEEAAQILINGDTTGSLRGSEKLVTESQKWISTQYKADAQQWGYIDPARWDGFYQWLWDNQLIEKELPKGTGYTNAYLS